MANLLQAIKTVVDNPISDLLSYYKGKNRINGIGDALEVFVKDIFADSLHETDESIKILKYSQVFSYLGNQNNPRDLILNQGDAVEVKKIESLNSGIHLNSSYPKSKLLSDSPMITKECRNSDGGNWQEKDLIYVIGVVRDSRLMRLWFISGDCYAADREVYERIRKKIATGIREIQDVEFSETKELGRINKIDPLGITYLRIRGMWGIENPVNVYDYLNIDFDINTRFQMIAIMTKNKYLSFSDTDRANLEIMSEPEFSIKDIEIQSPNNPAHLVSAKVLTYKN
jgi:hypothetical protein